MHLRYFKISKVALDRLPCFDLISPQQACLLASLELPRSTVTLSPCTSTRAAWSLPHQPSAPSFSLCREPSSPDSSATLSTASTATSGAVLAQGFSCRVGSAKLTLTALLCIFPGGTYSLVNPSSRALCLLSASGLGLGAGPGLWGEANAARSLQQLQPAAPQSFAVHFSPSPPSALWVEISFPGLTFHLLPPCSLAGLHWHPTLVGCSPSPSAIVHLLLMLPDLPTFEKIACKLSLQNP